MLQPARLCRKKKSQNIFGASDQRHVSVGGWGLERM